MFVCIDADNVAVAWNADGSQPTVPPGCTLVEVSQAPMFAACFFNGTQFVPLTVSAGNFMRALIELGHYDAIDAAVNSLTGQQGKVAKALWSRAVEFPRHDPLLLQIATAVGMTAADIDAVYILASSYN